MSHLHAQVRRIPEGWAIDDMDSRNGTRVNGVPIVSTKLNHGDLLEVGRSFYLFREDGAAAPGVAAPGTLRGLITSKPSLAEQFARLELVARSPLPILIRGETGTGKELVARAVHELSKRTGPLRAINCGALSRTLMESEFFGHRKGSFSGAHDDRPGLVRSADKGTLFLDEVGDLPAEGQAALLRVLQEGEVLPVGAVQSVPVNVRVVAATHRDLDAMVEREQFRSDLLARLAGFVVTLPPLRERREDLATLVCSLLERHAPDRAHTVEFSSPAIREIFTYSWPSNIRELDKSLMKALLLSDGAPIAWEHMRESTSGQSVPFPSRQGELTEDRRACLTRLLTLHDGNVSAVANDMRTSRMQVHRLCRRYGVSVRDYRRT